MCILNILVVHFCLVNDIAIEPIEDVSNLKTKIQKLIHQIIYLHVSV